MKIKLYEGVYWDTELEEQEQVTRDWINENVILKLGVNPSGKSFITPELDQYKRPIQWRYIGDGYIIEISREYMAPGKWAKRCDNIKVLTND